MKIFGIICAVILAVVALTFVGVSLGWLGAGADVVSARNVKDQWGEAYTANEALTAIAINVCAADKLVAASTSDNERIQRQTQAAAQEQNYARVASEYNAKMADGFQAKFVKPGDLPRRAATLAEAKLACQ